MVFPFAKQTDHEISASHLRRDRCFTSCNQRSCDDSLCRCQQFGTARAICRLGNSSDEHPGATANARYEVKQEAHYVTHAVGGSGAVREVVELILKAQGCWDEILKKYEIPLSHSHRIGFGG